MERQYLHIHVRTKLSWGVSLKNADLVDADLSNLNLKNNANLYRADLSYAKMIDTKLAYSSEPIQSRFNKCESTIYRFD